MKTICISCGSEKRDYSGSCPNCSFTPTSDEDLAKSRILSVPWSFGLPNGDVVETGRTPSELAEISTEIAAGGTYDFPSDELAKVVSILVEHRSKTSRGLVLDLIKWLAPPIVILAVVYYLLSRLG